jgi:hypothetical protein
MVGRGLQPLYHPVSHGNPSKFSIEILRRKRKKEGERTPLPLNPRFAIAHPTGEVNPIPVFSTE